MPSPYLLGLARNPWTAIGTPLLAGFALGLITKPAVDSAWFRTMVKPPLNPPNLLFPIAWTALYIGMGLSSHLLAKAYDRIVSPPIKAKAARAINLYWLQLLLNFAWTPLFFGLKMKALALADIVPLTLMVYRLTSLSFDLDSRAGLMLSAYSAWLTFATYLNGAFLYLNP